MSHAALAFEQCDRSFKAVFADPKPVRNQNSSGPPSQLSTPMSSEKDLYTGHAVAPLTLSLNNAVPSSNPGLLRAFPSAFDQVSASGLSLKIFEKYHLISPE
jgi:hypothetical protein